MMNEHERTEATGEAPMPSMPMSADLVVIGAGIAGLCAALVAAERGAKVVILDAHEPGGRASTANRDGFRLNVGAHGLYRGGHLTHMLTARGSEPAGGIVSTKSIGVLLDGSVHHLAMNPLGILRNPVLTPRSRVRMAALFARVPRMKTASLAGRSVREWLSDEPADLQGFMEMFIRLSTYTHAPDQFDAGAAAGQLQMAFKGVRYVDAGWIRIVESLRKLATSAGATVISHAEVTRVETDSNRNHVYVREHCISASAVVVATGGPDVAARLTGATVEGAEHLTQPVAVSCLDLGVRQPHDGLVLGMDQPVYLSPHAPLADLAPAGHGLVTVIRYLAPGESAGEAATAKAQLHDVARRCGIADEDIVMERALHRMVVTHGAPTAASGGLAGRPSIDALGLRGVFVAGDWVGPSSLIADASAASGEQSGIAAAALCASIVR